MNEKQNFQTRKITPLFQNRISLTPPAENDMLLFLDKPDGELDKMAFLNQCALSESSLTEWNHLNQIMNAGGDLPKYDPDPSIYARVLDAAYAAAAHPKPASTRFVHKTTFPGWRWAWAALFLALLWSGYQEIQPLQPTMNSKDTLDAELLTLDEQLNQLQTELGIDLEGA